MKRDNEAGPRGAAAFLARPIILAVAVIVLIGIYMAFLRGTPPTAVPPEDLDQRPTGAGTLPEGDVGQQFEGPNGTETGDFLDSTGATDLRPEILDPTDEPPAATSIEELDVPDRIQEGVVEPGPPEQ